MSAHRLSLPCTATLAVALALGATASAQVGTVKSFQKISNGGGNLPAILDTGDNFGWAAAGLGDLDLDGVRDVAIGALQDDGALAGGDIGAVWVLDLHTNGTVKSATHISTGLSGFGGVLNPADWFGWSVANVGDIDHDGVIDLAVGALQDDSAGTDAGAVWILFMNSNGTVKGQRRITQNQAGFNGQLGSFAWFGSSVVGLGDLDGDGVKDIGVGSHGDSEQGTFRGALWVLFLNVDGTVKTYFKINDLHGGLSATLDDGDEFGWSAANIGDLDRDGVDDLAVGANLDDDGGQDRGAVYLLLMTPVGAKATYKISNTAGGFTGVLDNRDQFGRSAAPLGDFDGDGVVDVLVGANWDDDGGKDRGAEWALFLNEDGTVKASQKISSLDGNFAGPLANEDDFGQSAGALGDLDGDGAVDFAVGADRDDDALIDSGATWVLFLKGGPFANLGHALKGSNGVPTLGGSGTLVGGTPATFTLKHAKPSSPSFLVIGAFQINAPLKGGVLVPSNNVLLTIPTNGSGQAVLPTTWPLGFPTGLSIYFQFWQNDAAGPVHFAASNGLKATGQ